MRHIHSNLGGASRVTVTDLKWPVLCVCCCGRAETTLKIEFDDTDDTGAVNYLATWQVPYCKACVAHVAEVDALRARTSWDRHFHGDRWGRWRWAGLSRRI